MKRASGLDQLDSFLSDRLAVALKTEGYRHDHIQAGLMAESHAFKPHSSVKRVAALAAFLATPDGQDLVAGYKRATNILRAEEKKTKTLHTGSHIATSLFCVQGEIDLHAALQVAENTARAAIVAEDYNAAMTALAALRGPVDAFFEGPHSVMVNADDAAIRQNRLNLLNALRLAIGHVADFSQLEG